MDVPEYHALVAAVPRRVICRMTRARWPGRATRSRSSTRRGCPDEEVVLRLTTPEEVVDAIRAARGAGRAGDRGLRRVRRRAGGRGDLEAGAADPRPRGRPRSTSRWAVDRVLRRAPRARRARPRRWRSSSEDVEACRLIGEHGRAELSHARAPADALQHRPPRDRRHRAPRSASSTRRPPPASRSRCSRARRARCCQGARLTAWELPARRHPGDGADRRRGGGAARARRRRRGDRRRRPRGGQRRRREQDRHLRARDRRAPPRRPVLRRRAALDARRRDARRAPTIEIEQRAGSEVRAAAGLPTTWRCGTRRSTSRPAALITAIITDAGVLRPPFEATIAAALGSATSAV